jgi:predicted phosphoribosyltransferase
LYVANQSGQVFVYDSARTRTNVTATVSRTIVLPFFTQHRLFLETTNDRLYASGQNRVVILNNAGTATGSVTAAAAQLSTMNSDLTAVVARP